jgi:hypothetical protein
MRKLSPVTLCLALWCGGPHIRVEGPHYKPTHKQDDGKTTPPMPWNDNAGPGPWGSPPPNGDKDNTDRPNPGPRRPAGGPGTSPRSTFEALEDLTDRVRHYFQGPDRPRAVATAAGAVVALWALTGVYVVQPNQQGVVSTFGAYSRVADPGLRYHLPIPIESVEKVGITEIRTTDIGASGTEGGEEPDADQRREHRRPGLLGAVACVRRQPKYLFNLRRPRQRDPRRRRERHARGGRQDRPHPDPDHRPRPAADRG